MADVRRQRPPHESGIVEDDERAGEVHRRHHRVGPEPQIRVVDGAEDPVAGAARAVGAGGHRAHEQGDRRAEDHGQRDEHDDEHVLDHVGGEQHPPVDHRPAGGHVDEQRHADQPQDQASDRPGVPAPAQAHEPGDVGDREADGDDHPQRVELPLGEERGPGGLRRQGLGGQPLGRGGHGRRLVGHGRLGAGEHGAERHDGREQQCLDADQAPELDPGGDGPARPGGLHRRSPGGGLRRGRARPPGSGAVRGRAGEAADDEAAVPPTDDAERRGEGDLDHDEQPVGGRPVGERVDAQDGVEEPGDDHECPGEQCQRGEPRDEHAEVPAAGEHGGEQREGQQPAEPHDDGDEVEPDAVDRLHVAGGLRRMPHEGLRDERDEGQDGDEADPGEAADREHEGGDDRGEHDDEGPHLAVGHLGDVHPELGGEVAGERLRPGGVDEGEDEHGDRGHGPCDRGDLGHPQARRPGGIELLVRVRLPIPVATADRGAAGQHHGGEHECADRHRHRGVEEELRRRQAEAAERAGVVEQGGGRGTGGVEGEEADDRAEDDEARERGEAEPARGAAVRCRPGGAATGRTGGARGLGGGHRPLSAAVGRRARGSSRGGCGSRRCRCRRRSRSHRWPPRRGRCQRRRR